MKNGLYLSRCGTMVCFYENTGKEKKLSYSIQASPMTVTKLRRWIYLGEE